MSKMKNLFAMSAGLMTLAMNNGIMPIERSIEPKAKQLTDEDKERIAKQYANEQHKFIIKGVEIIASNKKVAYKIFRKRKEKK